MEKSRINKQKTRCANLTHVINYFVGLGVDEKDILKGLSIDKDFIHNPNNWIATQDSFKIIERCQQLGPLLTPYDWEKIGLRLTDSNASHLFKMLVKLLGVNTIYRVTPRYIRSFNTYMNLELVTMRKGFADIIFKTDPAMISINMGSISCYSLGVLSAIPTPYNYEPAQTTILFDQVLLKNIINKMFKKLGLQYTEKGDHICVNDKPTGRRIQLQQEAIKGQSVLCDKYLFKKPYNAILITEDLMADGKVLIKKGDIYDAPYARCTLKWNQRLFSERLSRLFWSKSKICESLYLLLDEQIILAEKSFFEAEKLREKEHEANAALKDTLKKLDKEQKKVMAYSTDLEKQVNERTAKTIEMQAKLLQLEKRSLENRIAGGFAHEMRNALTGARLELESVIKYDKKGRSSPQVLKECTASLLRNITMLHEKFHIPKEEIAEKILPELNSIAEISRRYSDLLPDIATDLDRGLSITKQILDYAKINNFRPGDNRVDLVPMIERYVQRYKQDFERIGIRYSVDGVKEAIIRADEIHLNSIFNNLVLNAMDALEGYNAERQKEIRVLIKERNDEKGRYFVINVSDNGPGIPGKHVSEIFEPFFSTKQKLNSGLGLSIAKKLIQLYGGKIGIESKEDEGTTFTVTLPERHNG